MTSSVRDCSSVENPPTNREVLASLPERMELTAEKEAILFFRFRKLERQA